jgi:hypothetical protein
MPLSSHYAYDLKINQGAGLFTSEVFTEAFPGCGEVLVLSKNFNSSAECEKSLSNLLSSLSMLESKAIAKNHVVVTKRNPILTNIKTPIDAEENWADNVVLRAYVADAEQLKQSVLKYNLFAQVRAVEIYQNTVQ